jgi:hypothetical protein
MPRKKKEVMEQIKKVEDFIETNDVKFYVAIQDIYSYINNKLINVKKDKIVVLNEFEAKILKHKIKPVVEK